MGRAAGRGNIHTGSRAAVLGECVLFHRLPPHLCRWSVLGEETTDMSRLIFFRLYADENCALTWTHRVRAGKLKHLSVGSDVHVPGTGADH